MYTLTDTHTHTYVVSILRRGSVQPHHLPTRGINCTRGVSCSRRLCTRRESHSY